MKSGKLINDRFKDITNLVFKYFDKSDFIKNYIDVCMKIKDENIRNKLIQLIDFEN